MSLPPKLVVYILEEAELAKIKKLKVPYEVRKLAESEFNEEAKKYEAAVPGEKASPLFCFVFPDGERRCTLNFKDVARYARGQRKQGE